MSTRRQIAISAVLVSILANIVLALVKGAAGYIGNSYALVADAMESTADVLSSVMVLVGIKISTMPPDENHPYGHGRLEPLVTFAVVAFLIVTATIITVESIHHIQTPHEIPATFTLYVLAGVVVFKYFFFNWLDKKGADTGSGSIKADAWHHLSDALTSLFGFVGIFIAIFTGYAAADDWAAIIASVIILYNAFLIFRPAFGELMDENIHHDTIDKIRILAKEVDGVLYVEKCHVRKLGMQLYIDLHMSVKSTLTVVEGHDISHRLKDHLVEHLPFVADVLIHIEPEFDEYS